MTVTSPISILIALIGILIGIASTLLAVIGSGIKERLNAHESIDEDRFAQLGRTFEERHKENLVEFRRISKAQLMMMTAMLSTDTEAKQKLVSAVQELLI